MSNAKEFKSGDKVFASGKGIVLRENLIIVKKNKRTPYCYNCVATSKTGKKYNVCYHKKFLFKYVKDDIQSLINDRIDTIFWRLNRFVSEKTNLANAFKGSRDWKMYLVGINELKDLIKELQSIELDKNKRLKELEMVGEQK